MSAWCLKGINWHLWKAFVLLGGLSPPTNEQVNHNTPSSPYKWSSPMKTFGGGLHTANGLAVISSFLLWWVYEFWVPVEWVFLSELVSECEHILVYLSLDSLTICVAVYPQLASEAVILLCQKECRVIAINPQLWGGCCCLFCGCLHDSVI